MVNLLNKNRILIITDSKELSKSILLYFVYVINKEQVKAYSFAELRDDKILNNFDFKCDIFITEPYEYYKNERLISTGLRLYGAVKLKKIVIYALCKRTPNFPNFIHFTEFYKIKDLKEYKDMDLKELRDYFEFYGEQRGHHAGLRQK